MRQPAVILLQFGPCLGFEGQRLQFLDQPLQPLALARSRFAVLQRARQRLFALLPFPMQPADRRHLGGQPGVLVEQRALGGFAHQRLVRVLAVDVDQQPAQLLQLGHAGRRAIDVGAGAAAGVDHAPGDHHTLFRLEILLAQPVGQRVVAGTGEFGRQFGALAAISHHRRLGPAAHQQAERIHQNGFSGAGLAGQRAEAGRKIELQPVDQNEIADE